RTSNDNVIAWNDGSWAAAHAFEGTFSARNVSSKNVASDSTYGFWLGYSGETLVIDNLVERNRTDGISIGCGQSNRVERNTVTDTGAVAIHIAGEADNEVES